LEDNEGCSRDLCQSSFPRTCCHGLFPLIFPGFFSRDLFQGPVPGTFSRTLFPRLVSGTCSRDLFQGLVPGTFSSDLFQGLFPGTFPTPSPPSHTLATTHTSYTPQLPPSHFPPPTPHLLHHPHTSLLLTKNVIDRPRGIWLGRRLPKARVRVNLLKEPC
jgi:hypothetical protein